MKKLLGIVVLGLLLSGNSYEADVPQTTKEVHVTFVKNKEQKD